MPLGSEDRHPIIWFTSMDTAPLDRTKYRKKPTYHPLLKWVVWLLFILLIGKRLFQNSFTTSEKVIDKLPNGQQVSHMCLPDCLCNSHSVKSLLFWFSIDWRKGKILNLLLVRVRLFPEVLMNLFEDALFFCQRCCRKWSMQHNSICQ